MTTRNEVVEAARQYIGIKFYHQGRTKHGIDCVGLLLAVGRDIGLELEDYPTYTTAVEPEKFIHYIESQTDPLPKTPIRHGNIVLLRQAMYPMHCGIITKDKGRTQLIHASVSRGVTETTYDPWARNFIKFRNYPGVE